MPSIADVVESIEAALPGVVVLLGEEFQNENALPPRVVFIPRDDRFGPPRSVDRGHGAASAATRGVGLEVRVWGAATEEARLTDRYADLRAAELLLDKVLIAIRATCQGSFDFEQGEWTATSPSQLGRLYALRVRIYLPVVPAEEDDEEQTTEWTEVLAPAGTPAGTPDAIQTTIVLAADVTGTPTP